MILDEDSFSTVTSIADKGNFDIVSFRVVFSFHGSNLLTNNIGENFFSDQPPNLVLYQPELGLL